MTVIDTSLLSDRISEGKVIDENVCLISIIEYPPLLEYPRFEGKVLLAELQDFELALDIQREADGARQDEAGGGICSWLPLA